MSGSDFFPCWYPVQIRFRDLDPLAHVNNTVYLIYFEEARSHYLGQLKPWREEWPSEEEHRQPEAQEAQDNPRIQTGPRGHHYGLLVKEISCTYQLPLVRSDQSEVGVRVVKVGHTSFVMEHCIRDTREHERIFATGRSVMVWCNYHTGRPYPVPSGLRRAFEEMEGRVFPEPDM
ncbi:MAG: acyl-CoA thioesterase [Chloroflexota bacterium]|nr:acyl-CoA thioesterase [Chloroflexota bacterium]